MAVPGLHCFLMPFRFGCPPLHFGFMSIDCSLNFLVIVTAIQLLFLFMPALFPPHLLFTASSHDACFFHEQCFLFMVALLSVLFPLHVGCCMKLLHVPLTSVSFG